MKLSEIRTMRQTCRANIEDLLGRTSSREMSTEENQMFTDLKAEGERLASLESRYAVLESFDTARAAPIIRQPIAPTGTDRTAAFAKALDSFMRTGTMATDTPLQIQQSPISGVAAAVPDRCCPKHYSGHQRFRHCRSFGRPGFSTRHNQPPRGDDADRRTRRHNVPGRQRAITRPRLRLTQP